MKFYILSNDDETLKSLSPNSQYIGRWCDATEVDRKNGPGKDCPLCGRPVTGFSWEEPRKMRLSNTRYPDRITYWILKMIVSERFMNAYLEAELSGINSFSKIEVVKVSPMGKKSPPPPNYYLADVGFSQTVTIDTKNTIIYGSERDWSCPFCNPLGRTCNVIEHLALNTDEWDGTDIFKLYHPSNFVCSQRFCDFINNNGFTNFNLVPVEKYTWR